jgi:hypothetical protein
MSVFKVVKKKIDNKIFYGILVIMKKEANHYIDNKEFFQAMCEWKDEIKEAEASGR